jgi:transcription antitermination factor NusG
MSNAAWYVVESWEGKDADAYLRLAAALSMVPGFKVWRPFDPKRASKRHGGDRNKSFDFEVSKIPRFGRYMFVHCVLTDSLRHAIANTPSVRGFLCASLMDRPPTVSEKEIQYYQDYTPPKVENMEFKTGAIVRINEGHPFAELSGRILDVDKKGILKVDVKGTSGAVVRIIIEPGSVSLVSAQATPGGKKTIHGMARVSA